MHTVVVSIVTKCTCSSEVLGEGGEGSFQGLEERRRIYQLRLRGWERLGGKGGRGGGC